VTLHCHGRGDGDDLKKNTKTPAGRHLKRIALKAANGKLRFAFRGTSVASIPQSEAARKEKGNSHHRLRL
jgi:hypothetical protein